MLGHRILATALSLIFFGARVSSQIIDSHSSTAGDVIAYCLVTPGLTDRYEMYTINDDGTGNARSMDITTNFNEVAYAPDGKSVISSGFLGADYSNISIYGYTFSIGTLQRFTTTPNVWDNHPAYSPNGSLIVFSRRYPPQWSSDDIWIMNSDGTNQHYFGVKGYHVRFSPDGTKLAYGSDSSGYTRIFTCNIDGTGVQMLTSGTFHDGDPSWSPDGTKIVFWSGRDGNGELYVMNADGAQVQRLTNTTSDETAPEWSPDGTQIVCTVVVPGPPNAQVYVMNADGSNRRQLTNVASPGWAQEPTWKPRLVNSMNARNGNTPPRIFQLHQNYPNPFNPSTTIRFELTRSSQVKLELFDFLGREVRIFVDGYRSSGSYSIQWNGTDKRGNQVASGIYLVRLTDGEFRQVQKALFIQ